MMRMFLVGGNAYGGDMVDSREEVVGCWDASSCPVSTSPRGARTQDAVDQVGQRWMEASLGCCWNGFQWFARMGLIENTVGPWYLLMVSGLEECSACVLLDACSTRIPNANVGVPDASYVSECNLGFGSQRTTWMRMMCLGF